MIGQRREPVGLQYMSYILLHAALATPTAGHE